MSGTDSTGSGVAWQPSRRWRLLSDARGFVAGVVVGSAVWFVVLGVPGENLEDAQGARRETITVECPCGDAVLEVDVGERRGVVR